MNETIRQKRPEIVEERVTMKASRGRGTSRIASVAMLTAAMAVPSVANADADFAKKTLKKMSDYLAAQDTISFDYDASLDVVTKDDQTLALASSGSVTLDRPDKFVASRSGGFADVEMIFNGETLTLFGKTKNTYTQIKEPGSIDDLVNALREKYGRPLPAADLLMSNVYGELMNDDVTDVKDLGSGVIGGVECDTFAFRTEKIDWQIWIAHGEHPYPCRYTISSKDMAHSPEYTIQVRNWKAGAQVSADTFEFNNSSNATKIEPEELKKQVKDLPENFKMGEGQ